MSSSSAVQVLQAARDEHIAAARDLLLEYHRWLNVDPCFQGFDQELAALPGKYAPPDGRLLLAYADGSPAGCVALMRLDKHLGEVKRLYVRPPWRGRGIGRALVRDVIDAGREIGYRRLVLDTLDFMREAIALYEVFGFREIPPYYVNPLTGAKRYGLTLGN